MAKTKGTKPREEFLESNDLKNVVEESEVLESTQEQEETNTPKVKNKKVVEPKPLILEDGVVRDCTNLRVRKGASIKSEIVTEIRRGTIVQVDLENSTETFYKVIVPATSRGQKRIEGYCLKDYIGV